MGGHTTCAELLHTTYIHTVCHTTCVFLRIISHRGEAKTHQEVEGSIQIPECNVSPSGRSG